MSFFEGILYMAWRGVAIGLIISAPMGPVGMLCIQRALDKGRRAGFYTGIGAAISDLFYSLLTGFGLSFIEDFLERNQNIIQLVGSFVLIGFGIYLFRKNPSKGLKKPVSENISVKKSILTGFLFTVSNPLILFLIIGLFARFNFILPAEPQSQLGVHLIQYVIGFACIYAGALIWWWFITFSVDKVRSHFNLRSMWLINKIIGIIILLFAIVGIFTSVSALAGASDIKCWNATRGYGPFCLKDLPEDVETSRGFMANNTADTLSFIAPLDAPEVLEFRCKIRNRTPRKEWGMVVSGKDASRLYIDIRATEGDFDGISTTPLIEITYRSDGRQPSKKSFADNSGLLAIMKSGMRGLDPTGATNFFKIVILNRTLTLFGGLHSPERLLQFPLPDDFIPAGIGFYVMPGGCLLADEIRLSTESFDSVRSVWESPDLLDEYLSASYDIMEGYWQTLDRSLEESLIRLGGDYRYAMVRAEEGYDLLYLSGARVNAPAWRFGMVKASLRPSGITGIWEVEWHDAMHKTMGHEIKAQADKDGTLTIQFPYQDSQLRLHRTATVPSNKIVDPD